MTLRKARKTFSLDPELVSFLESERAERCSESASSVLEDILRERKQHRERARIEEAIANYYGSLSDDEREEERNWGAFAESQFPRK